jgi:hypothetical protein
MKRRNFLFGGIAASAAVRAMNDRARRIILGIVAIIGIIVLFAYGIVRINRWTP